MRCSCRYAFALLALLACIVPGCATEPGGSISGAWQFNASWGAGCSMSEVTLTLLPTSAGWMGTLKGGLAGCDGPPGESSVPELPLHAVLDNIRVSGDSISFVLVGDQMALRGTITSDRMEGVMAVVGPFCQCTDPTQTGTWSATR